MTTDKLPTTPEGIREWIDRGFLTGGGDSRMHIQKNRYILECRHIIHNLLTQLEEATHHIEQLIRDNVGLKHSRVALLQKNTKRQAEVALANIQRDIARTEAEKWCRRAMNCEHGGWEPQNLDEYCLPWETPATADASDAEQEGERC